MPQVNLPYTLTPDTTADANQVQGNDDALANAVNALDDDNVAAGANIDPSKIGDYSATDAESRTVSTPGTSASPTKATTLEAEIAQLRYVAKRAGIGLDAKRNDGTTTTDDGGWQDGAVFGPNLIRNGGFSILGASNVPSGWAIVGTTPTIAAGSNVPAEGAGLPIQVTASGSTNQGLSITLAGLKASTKYLVGVRAKATSGDTAKLTTTGATGASFGNLDLSTTSTSFVTLAGVILTDATPTDVVVNLLSAADTDVSQFINAYCYELGDNPVTAGTGITRRLSDGNDVTSGITSTRATVQLDVGNTGSANTDMSLAVVAPGPGYEIEANARVEIENNVSTKDVYIELEENGSVVDHSCIQIGTSAATLILHYTNTAPTPGTTYTYVVKGDASGNVNINVADVSGGTPLSWIEVRLRKVG